MFKSARPYRRHTFITAQLRDGDKWVPVKIGNLSAGGVMVKSTKRPAVGSQVELRRRGLVIEGEVAWTSATRFGVRSFAQIDQADLTDEEPERRLQAVAASPKKGFWHWRKSRQ